MDEFYEIIMQEGLLYNAVCEYCVFDMISPTMMLVNKSIILNNYDIIKFLNDVNIHGNMKILLLKQTYR